MYYQSDNQRKLLSSDVDFVDDTNDIVIGGSNSLNFAYNRGYNNGSEGFNGYLFVNTKPGIREEFSKCAPLTKLRNHYGNIISQTEIVVKEKDKNGRTKLTNNPIAKTFARMIGVGYSFASSITYSNFNCNDKATMMKFIHDNFVFDIDSLFGLVFAYNNRQCKYNNYEVTYFATNLKFHDIDPITPNKIGYVSADVSFTAASHCYYNTHIIDFKYDSFKKGWFAIENTSEIAQSLAKQGILLELAFCGNKTIDSHGRLTYVSPLKGALDLVVSYNATQEANKLYQQSNAMPKGIITLSRKNDEDMSEEEFNATVAMLKEQKKRDGVMIVPMANVDAKFQPMQAFKEADKDMALLRGLEEAIVSCYPGASMTTLLGKSEYVNSAKHNSNRTSTEIIEYFTNIIRQFQPFFEKFMMRHYEPFTEGNFMTAKELKDSVECKFTLDIDTRNIEVYKDNIKNTAFELYNSEVIDHKTICSIINQSVDLGIELNENSDVSTMYKNQIESLGKKEIAQIKSDTTTNSETSNNVGNP